MKVTFTIPGEPVGKARARVTKFGSYTPEKTVLYENFVKTMYLQQNVKRFGDNEPLALHVSAYYKIPASISLKKRQQILDGEILPMKKPDWDNVGKIISDALNGVAYRDDVQIVDCRITKRYSTDPHVFVQIETIKEV